MHEVQNSYGSRDSFEANSPTCSDQLSNCNEDDNVEKKGDFGIWSVEGDMTKLLDE